MLGNDLRSPTKVNYVAAKAFSGEYTVNIQRVWGQPLGSKARLEIIQHQGTPEDPAR